MTKYRIQIEMTCDECDGKGKIPAVVCSEVGELQCSGCEGTGWQQEYASLDELKEILESGDSG